LFKETSLVLADSAHDDTALSTLSTIQAIVDKRLLATDDREMRSFSQSLHVYRSEVTKQAAFLKEVSNLADPSKLIELGDREYKKALTTEINRDFFFQRAFKCYEKAARLFENSGEPEKALALRYKIGRAPFDASSPLATLNETPTSASHTLDFGTLSPQVGEEEVKYGFFRYRTDVQGKVNLELKLTHTASNPIHTAVESLKAKESEVADLLNITSFSIQESKYPYVGKDLETGKLSTYQAGDALCLHFGGLAKVYIGHQHADKDRIKFIFEKKPEPQDLQMLLSFLGLSSATTHMSEDATKKYKLNKALHFLFPKVGYEIERNAKLQSLPWELYIKEIEKAYPKELEEALPCINHLHLSDEIPGMRLLALGGIVETLKSKKATSFFVGVGSSSSMTATARAVKGILQHGFMSSQARFDMGLFIRGASSGSDYQEGSSDSVFTRLLSESNSSEEIKYFPFCGKFQFVVDLEAAKFMPYCYEEDLFGQRVDTELYTSRPSLVELAEKKQEEALEGNEVMFKEMIPPKFIKKILYQDPRKELVEYIENNKALSIFFPLDVSDKMAYLKEHRLELVHLMIENGQIRFNRPVLRELKYKDLSISDWLEDKEKCRELINFALEQAHDFFPEGYDHPAQQEMYLRRNIEKLVSELLKRKLVEITPEVENELYLWGTPLPQLFVDPKEAFLAEVGDLQFNGVPAVDLLEETTTLR
jgi:hypothetical protein